MTTHPNAQQEFLQELDNFIKNHKYYQSLQGETHHQPQNDTQAWTISDPDGDYEEIRIQAKLIS